MDPVDPRSPLAAETDDTGRRLIALSLLLFGEFLLTSLRVDAYAIASLHAGWAHVLAYAGQFTRFGLGFCAAFVIATWPRLAEHLRSLRRHAATHRWQPVALAQLLCFALFYALSVELFDRSTGTPESSGAVALAWTLSALSLLVLSAASLAPTPFWRELFARERMALLLAAGVGAAIWSVARMSQELWGPLAEMTFQTAFRMLRAVYPPSDLVADFDARTLGTRWFRVNIAAACSGYEGMGLVTGFLALYLGLFRRELRFPHVLLLFPLGMVVIWLFNAARIAALIVIGSEWSEDVALGGFHSQAGWIAFTAVALVLIRLIDRTPWLARRHAPPQLETRAPVDESSAALLAPLVALLATTLLGSAFVADFDWWYPLRVVAVLGCLYRYRRTLRDSTFRLTLVPVLAGGLAFLLWLALVPPNAAYDHAFAASLNSLPQWLAAVWLVVRTIGSVITVPIAEELAFRGYLMSRLCGREPLLNDRLSPSLFAVVVSSLGFGLLHGDWLAGSAAGLVYAGVRYRRGSVLDAVLAHMTTNALVSANALLFGAWIYW